MDDNAKLFACTQYLRRTNYAAGVYDIAKIRQISVDAFADASEQVVITGTSSELGAASGVVSFEKWILIMACEQLLMEIDPDNTPMPPPRGALPDYSFRPTAT